MAHARWFRTGMATLAAAGALLAGGCGDATPATPPTPQEMLTAAQRVPSDIPVIPLYGIQHMTNGDTLYTAYPEEIKHLIDVKAYSEPTLRIQCFILKDKLPGTIPIYRCYADLAKLPDSKGDHALCTDVGGAKPGEVIPAGLDYAGYTLEHVVGYAFPTTCNRTGVYDLIRLHNDKTLDNAYTAEPAGVIKDYTSKGSLAKVFPEQRADPKTWAKWRQIIDGYLESQHSPTLAERAVEAELPAAAATVPATLDCTIKEVERSQLTFHYQGNNTLSTHLFKYVYVTDISGNVFALVQPHGGPVLKGTATISYDACPQGLSMDMIVRSVTGRNGAAGNHLVADPDFSVQAQGVIRKIEYTRK